MKENKSNEELYQVLENMVKLLGIGFVVGGLVSYKFIKDHSYWVHSLSKKHFAGILFALVMVAGGLFGGFYLLDYQLKFIFLPILSIWVMAGAIVFLFSPLWLKLTKTTRITENDLSNKKVDFSKLPDLLRNPNEVPIGVSMKSFKPYTLPMSGRCEHLLVSGATGQGKTSLMITMLKHAFMHNHAVIIIDPKGELIDINHMKSLAKMYGKKDEDFLLFTFANIGISDAYNILRVGTPEQKKSKIKIGLGLEHEHYGAVAAQALGTFIDILDYLGEEVTLKKLRDLFVDKTALSLLEDRIHRIKNEEDARLFLGKLDLIREKRKEDFSGVVSKLDNLCAREFMPILGNPSRDKKQIDLLEVIQKKKIAYFQMNTNAFEETSKRVGKLIIQDLKLVTNMMQSGVAPMNKDFAGVFIDEFGSFATADFADFLKQVRSSKVGLHLFFQGSADLRKVSPEFEDQVLGNTLVKIIFRQDIDQDVEKWAGMAGTENTIIESFQTDRSTGYSQRTGMGNVHEGKRMRIEFDVFKNLTTGKAVVIDKGRRTQDLIAVWNGKN
jgi:hypothetical protein